MVLAWFTTFKFELAVVIDEYKRELRQHLKLLRKFAPFPPVKTPKMILDFTVVIFQKERQFDRAKVSYELLDY